VTKKVIIALIANVDWMMNLLSSMLSSTSTVDGTYAHSNFITIRLTVAAQTTCEVVVEGDVLHALLLLPRLAMRSEKPEHRRDEGDKGACARA
jgi:type 1 fimbria pilin